MVINQDFEFPENTGKEDILKAFRFAHHPSKLDFIEVALNKFLADYPKKISAEHLSDINQKFREHPENKYDRHLSVPETV